MATYKAVIVAHSLKRWVVVAVDQDHRDVRENIVTELSKHEIGLASL